LAINRDKVEAAAIKLLQQGKYEKALAELRRLVDDDPTDVRTLLKLGDTYVKVGNKRDSIEAYERAAAIYTEQGFFLKAVAVYKQILRVDANIPELHLKLAELYQQLGLTSDALQHYQNVAVFHEQQGRARDALEMLRRMVDLDPDNIASRIKLGELFAQQGLAPEATQELRNALSFLKSQQRYDDYVRVGEKLVAYDPGSVDVARELAQIYMQRQQPSVALGKLQMCFRADPRDVEILSLIAQAFLDMQQIGKTVSVFKEMAKIYATDGQAELARSTWERVLSLSPGDAEAEEALGRSVVAPRPTVVPTVVAGGAVAPSTPMAVATMAPPLRASPDEEQLQRLLTETDVYVKYGLKEKAIEHLQKVFSIRPDHVGALEKLKNLQQAVGGGDLRETLRRLASAAEAQRHPRAGEWRAELAGLAEQRPLTSPGVDLHIRSNLSMSGEGEVVVVDDPSNPHRAMIDDQGVMHLDDEASGVIPLEASELDRPFLSSEDELSALPPDEEDPVTMAGARAEIPRMPTGVNPAPRASPFSAQPPAPPLELEDAIDLVDADALVRQALQDINADDVVAAADELLLESSLDAFGGQQPMGGLADDQVIDEEPARSFEDPAIRTGPARSPLMGPATTTSGQRLGVTAPTMSVPGGVDDDEIDRLAREAVADADRRLGEYIEATAIHEPSPEQQAHLRAVSAERYPELDIDAYGGSAFEEATLAQGVRSSDVPTDERPKRGPVAPAAPRGAPQGAQAPAMVDAFSGLGGPDDRGAMTATTAPAAPPRTSVGGGFEGEFSEEFDPSSFDLPADVKELLRRPSAERAPAPAPVASTPSAAPVVTAVRGDLGVADKAHGWEGDPANDFFPQELEESEFFIQQELLDEAKEILTSILEDVPDSARVQWMMARIEAKERGEPEPPAPWEQKLDEQILEEVQAHLDDLGFGDEPNLPFGDATAQISVEEVLSQFKKGVAETVPEEDAATHYELGIAYREMGLHDDAVAEFQLAARAPARAADARFLIGLVRRDQGQLDAALQAFEEALSVAAATRDQRGAAEYERGVCLEELGRYGEAQRALQAAKANGSAAVDLDRRIKSLVDRLGEGGDMGVNGNGASNGHGPSLGKAGTPGPGRGPKNIDYV
jgi:pilus assembly protein FimV